MAFFLKKKLNWHFFLKKKTELAFSFLQKPQPILQLIGTERENHKEKYKVGPTGEGALTGAHTPTPAFKFPPPSAPQSSHPTTAQHPNGTR